MVGLQSADLRLNPNIGATAAAASAAASAAAANTSAGNAATSAAAFTTASGTGGPTGYLAQTYLDNRYDIRYFGDVKAQYGAIGNGVADDSAAFTAARASGLPVIHVPPGTYLLDGITLSISNQTWLLDPGVTLKAKSGGSQTLFTITGAGVSIIGNPNVTIDGNNVGSGAGSTLYVNSGDDFTIDYVKLINCAGLGINAQCNRPKIRRITCINAGNGAIYIAPPTTLADIENPEVSNCVIRSINNVSGIEVQGRVPALVLRPHVVNNDVTLPGVSGVHIGIEFYGGVINGVAANNTVKGGALAFSFSTSISCAGTNNTIVGAADDGMEMAACDSCTFAGNTIDGSGICDIGFSVVNSGNGNNTITGNTVRNLDASVGTGVRIANTSGYNTVVSGNTIIALQPVLVSNGYGCAITGNVFKGSGSTTAAVAFDTTTDSACCNNMCDNTGAALNTFGGTKARITLGPDYLVGGTSVELINGPLGPGSRTV